VQSDEEGTGMPRTLLAFRMLLTHPWPIARPFIAGGVHTISLRFLEFSAN
jgi:hypothetical protein